MSPLANNHLVNVRSVPLANNHGCALVDEGDFAFVSEFSWQISGSGGYARGYVPEKHQKALKLTQVYMHRLILRAGQNQVVDHINGNGLDNRRANLRLCSPSANSVNRHRLSASNTSGVSGVWFWRARKRWRASISVERRTISLGTFLSKEEAVAARKCAEVKYWSHLLPVIATEAT